MAVAPISRLFTINTREQLDQNLFDPSRATTIDPTAVPTIHTTMVPTVSTNVAQPLSTLTTSHNIARGDGGMLNEDLRQRATAPNPAGKKAYKPPKHYELYKMIPQSVELCYKAVATFAYACFFLVRDDFLVWDDGTDMRPTLACLNKRWYKMVKRVLALRDYDFSWLIKPREGYAQQEHISSERVKAATACAIHYGNDLGLVARFLDMETGEITGAWRNIKEILGAAAGLVTTEILRAMKRILTRGCPAYFNWEEPAENKEAFLSRGNNPSIEMYPDIVEKTTNKEDRNGHVITFEDFIVFFSAFARATPQHIIAKLGKKPRLIWDGKTKLFAHETTMNEATPIDRETPVMFGLVFLHFCTWIWNMRISYPDQDIYLAFIDISSCFRFPRVFPDLIGAFGFMIGSLYFASNAMVFGSIVSASSWEPFRVAIAAIATSYYVNKKLVQKHKHLLDMITWEKALQPIPQLVRATACSKNKGIINEDGTRQPTPHEIYVDDDLIADLLEGMPYALASAAEAIFTVMGVPAEHLRQCAVALDKWTQLVVAPRNILLGLVFDTRKMIVGITKEYRKEVLKLLTNNWHAGRQSFTVKKMEELVGKLGRIGQAFRAIYHLMPHLFSSVAYALRENENFLMTSSKKFRKMVKRAKAKPIPKTSEDEREINFAISQVAKKKHGCDQLYRIPQSMKDEIAYITKIIADDSIELSTPIGHIVDRDPAYEQGADSCKKSGGGWCIDLFFWWFLDYPDDIVQRAYLENNKSGQLISINVLEMVCVIVNLAAAIYACWHDQIDLSTHPVILDWCDSKSATCWTNTRCKSSMLGRALGRIFCGLLMSTKLGIQAEWLPSALNKIADDISRLKMQGDGTYKYSQLLIDHPCLRTCRQFQPSDTLLGMIWDVLRNSALPDPLILRKLKPETLGSFISSSS